jgi:hypothetical protein
MPQGSSEAPHLKARRNRAGRPRTQRTLEAERISRQDEMSLTRAPDTQAASEVVA